MTILVCERDFHAPPERILRSPGFCEARARYWLGWQVGIPGILDRLAAELLDHHTGRLFWNGQEIDRLAVDIGTGDDWIDAAFGADPFRDMRNFLERAERGFKNRLCKKLMHRVLLLWFAEQIAECATQGTCHAPE